MYNLKYVYFKILRGARGFLFFLGVSYFTYVLRFSLSNF